MSPGTQAPSPSTRWSVYLWPRNSLLKWSQAYIPDLHRLLPHILCHQCACSEAHRATWRRGAIGMDVNRIWIYKKRGTHIYTSWGPGSQLSLTGWVLNLNLTFQRVIFVKIVREKFIYLAAYQPNWQLLKILTYGMWASHLYSRPPMLESESG